MIDGVGLLTGRVTAIEVPPPGAGFAALIECIAAVARSAAVSTAVSCVPLTNVVCRALPSTCTDVALTKPLPVMVTEAEAEPAVNALGEICAMAGTGLLICRLVELTETLLPVLLAAMDAVPAVVN